MHQPACIPKHSSRYSLHLTLTVSSKLFVVTVQIGTEVDSTHSLWFVVAGIVASPATQSNPHSNQLKSPSVVE